MQISFYATDTYATAKRKFKDAWPNLFVEVHHAGSKYHYEGWDEFSEDAPLISNTDPAYPVFTLTEETLAGETIRLFSIYFGGEALVLDVDGSIEKNETLAYGNDPFILPLNNYTYSEYKQRFTERWPNLSMRLYTTQQGNAELANDTVMKGVKGLRTALNDYTFIFPWQHTLSRIGLTAAITNNRLYILWDSDMLPLRLKEFQALLKKENAYTVQP